jgi:hypothetical protein
VHSQDGDVGIVFNEYRDAQVFLEFLLERSFQPSRLGRNDVARFEIHGARSAVPTPATCLIDKSASSTASRTHRSMRSTTASHPLRLGAELGHADAFMGSIENAGPGSWSARSTPTTYSALLVSGIFLAGLCWRVVITHVPR